MESPVGRPALEVGDEDPNLDSNRPLSEQLTRLGIEHSFEVYERIHTNRVGQRIERSALPFFFSRHVAGEASRP